MSKPVIPSVDFDIKDYRKLLGSESLDQLVSDPAMRFDSAEDATVFFARELDNIKTETYDVLYPEFTALRLFPTSSEVNIGAETITWYSYDKTGLAKIIHNYATDLPRVDVKGKPYTSHIKSIGDAYGYSIQEMRASRMAGKSLDVRKGEAARYAIEYQSNRIAWAGDEEAQLMGVLSPWNDVPIYAMPANAAGTSTRFEDKTPAEILANISAAYRFVAFITKSVEKPDTLALPTDAYLHLFDTPRSDASDLSVGQWILKNMPRLKNIEEAPELNSDSDITPYPGQGTGLFYKKDKRKLTIETPLPFYQHPIQPKGLEFEIPCESREAGAIIYYPLSMLILFGV